MSPWEEQRERTRRVNRRALWLAWAVLISAVVIVLSFAQIARQAQRTNDIAQAQETQRAERFRDTLSSCEEQNVRNGAAAKQLETFLTSLAPDGQTTVEQRRVVRQFSQTLADVFLPARLDADGKSTCRAYAESRVRPSS